MSKLADLLPESALLALVSLAEGDKNGYAIMQDVRGFSHTRVGPGSVYGTLHRLEDDGLIESDESAGFRQYHLTQRGVGILAIRVVALASLTTLARQRVHDFATRMADQRTGPGQLWFEVGRAVAEPPGTRR